MRTDPKLLKSIRTGRRQYGVLPLLSVKDGAFMVLLITSRDIGRWVIPRGWPMIGVANSQAASIEAYEEAGIEGRILGAGKFGSFRYRKVRRSGHMVRLWVDVFLFAVDVELDDWPEKKQRTRRWFDPKKASTVVAEPELAKLLRRVRRRSLSAALALD
jgi:8-oxo-dGTP pyrophosphatase MutT (NUDIX family)